MKILYTSISLYLFLYRSLGSCTSKSCEVGCSKIKCGGPMAVILQHSTFTIYSFRNVYTPEVMCVHCEICKLKTNLKLDQKGWNIIFYSTFTTTDIHILYNWIFSIFVFTAPWDLYRWIVGEEGAIGEVLHGDLDVVPRGGWLGSSSSHLADPVLEHFCAPAITSQSEVNQLQI